MVGLVVAWIVRSILRGSADASEGLPNGYDAGSIMRQGKLKWKRAHSALSVPA